MAKWKVSLKNQRYKSMEDQEVQGILKKFKPPYKDQFLPVSVAALIFSVSTQTIRLLMSTGKVRIIKTQTGPALISVEDIYNLRGDDESKSAKSA